MNLRQKLKKRKDNIKARAKTVALNEDTRKGVVIAEIAYLPEQPKQYTVYLERRTGENEGLIGLCTCEQWSFGPTQELYKLGVESVKHSKLPNHHLRQH